MALAIIGAIACGSGLAPEEANQRFPTSLRILVDGLLTTAPESLPGQVHPGFGPAPSHYLPQAMALASYESFQSSCRIPSSPLRNACSNGSAAIARA